MTIPKEAIEKAIEGGYDGAFTNPLRQLEYRKSPSEIALDPLFWQALGKSLGWDEKWNYAAAPADTEWQYHAMGFYDLILTNGDTDKFWADLLASK